MVWLAFIQNLPSWPQLTSLESFKAQTFADSHSAQVATLATSLIIFPIILVVIVLTLLSSIWLYTRFYVIVPNNEAFVRTGGIVSQNKVVLLNGGCIVLPGFHKLTRIPLQEIPIDIELMGNRAVRTQDNLQAGLSLTFYVCINASALDVLTAAARLSQNGKITPTDIQFATEKRAIDAVRTVAKQKRFAEINSDTLRFVQEVITFMQQDLSNVGLTINNIAISQIQEVA